MITSLLALISLDRTINSCQRNLDPRYGSIHECSYSYTCAHCLRELGLHHRDTWLEQILILTCLIFKVRVLSLVCAVFDFITIVAITMITQHILLCSTISYTYLRDESIRWTRREISLISYIHR